MYGSRVAPGKSRAGTLTRTRRSDDSIDPFPSRVGDGADRAPLGLRRGSLATGGGRAADGRARDGAGPATARQLLPAERFGDLPSREPLRGDGARGPDARARVPAVPHEQ